MAKHPTDIPGFPTPMHAAEYIENLRYDSLALFLLELKRALVRRTTKDYEADRFQLASQLDQAATFIGAAHEKIDQAWRICQPHMRVDYPDDPDKKEED